MRSRLLFGLAALVVLAGCTGGSSADPSDLGALAQLDGEYHVTYEMAMSGSSAAFDTYEAYSTDTWIKETLNSTYLGSTVRVDNYRHRGSGESFVCAESPSTDGTECRFFSSYSLFFPLLPTDARTIPMDPSFAHEGTETVQGRECGRFSGTVTVRELFDDYLNTSTGSVGDQTQLDRNISMSVCIDTGKGYVARYRARAVDTQEGDEVHMNVSSYDGSVSQDAVQPPVDVVMSACRSDDGYPVKILPVTTGGEATLTVNGNEQTVSLTELEQKTVQLDTADLSSGANEVTLELGDITVTDTCRYFDTSFESRSQPSNPGSYSPS